MPKSETIDRWIVGPVRAREVNPTPADLGGVTSFLYELEYRYEGSFLAPRHALAIVSIYSQTPI